jgi:hypothetical protein
MTLENFIEGCKILQPYYENPNGYHLGAEHDQIFVYATQNPLSENDVQKMRDLGFFQPDTSEEQYDAEDGWSAFV